MFELFSAHTLQVVVEILPRVCVVAPIGRLQCSHVIGAVVALSTALFSGPVVSSAERLLGSSPRSLRWWRCQRCLHRPPMTTEIEPQLQVFSWRSAVYEAVLSWISYVRNLLGRTAIAVRSPRASGRVVSAGSARNVKDCSSWIAGYQSSSVMQSWTSVGEYVASRSLVLLEGCSLTDGVADGVIGGELFN
jgi:hypothetical protein